MKIGTPNNIEVLLHYHTSPSPHPRILAPAVSEATKMLLREGCIMPYPIDASNLFRTTRKGKALVQLLCGVEIPREVYVDGGGNIIEETKHQQTTP